MIAWRRHMNTQKIITGRPRGRKKTAKIEIMIEPDAKLEFMKLMSEEGKMASVEIGMWIKKYISDSKSKEN